MNNDVKDNTNVKQTVPFFRVVNMDTSLNFYRNGLGFELKNKWEPSGKIEWCHLQLGNASIMLQEYRQSPSNEKLGQSVIVYFWCDDAIAIHNQIIVRGLLPSEPIVENNQWVVGLIDPDGYNIYFESPTDVPEDTLYSVWLKTNTKVL